MSNLFLSNLNQKFLENKTKLQIILHIDKDIILDLTSQIESFDLEFQMNKFSRGYFIYNDVSGHFFNRFIITGEEKITISISSVINDKMDFSNWTKEYVLYGYEMIDKTDIGIDINKNRYKFLFCSKIQLLNHQSVLQKAYRGRKSGSDIVEDLLKNHYKLKNDEYDLIRSTEEYDDFICPNMYAKDIIDKIKKSSQTKEAKDFFVFYEGRNKVNFKPLSSYLNKKAKIELIRNPGGNPEGFILTQIREEETINGVNIIRSLMRRGLGATYSYFNEEEKNIIEIKRTVDKDYLNNIYTMGHYSMYSPDFLKNCVNSNNLAFFSTTDHKRTLDPFIDYSFASELMQRNIMKLTIPANLFLEIGDLIYLKMMCKHDVINYGLSGHYMIIKVTYRYKMFNENKSLNTKFMVDYHIVKNGYDTLMGDTINRDKLIKKTNVDTISSAITN